jgi:hypothetical protein
VGRSRDIDQDLRIVVTEWIFSRVEDPFGGGVRREPDFENLWFGEVPNSHDGKGHVVVCSYWVHAADNIVVCDNFGLLSSSD